MIEKELLHAYAEHPTLQDRVRNLAHHYRQQSETAHIDTAALLLTHARQLEALL